jgi:hypothetical protein
LRLLFERTIKLGWDIYGDRFAKPWDTEKHQWTVRPQVAFSDAVMVGLSRHLDYSDLFVNCREDIVADTQRLFETTIPGTFTGRGNTKKDVQERIQLYEEMLLKHAK